MSFTLIPYSDSISLSKEEKSKKMAAGRVKTQKARCELEVSKLEEEVTSLEGQVQELAAKEAIDIHAIGEKLDELALVTRKLEQLKDVVTQLFPAAAPSA